MRVGAVSMVTLLLSTVASGTQDVAVEQDVVVIGRRMRLVRLDYALNGAHLRRCDVKISSGDARVDRIMCAVLRRCVTAGYREPRPAKRCLDASIDMFTSGQRRPPAPDPVGPAMPPPRFPPTVALEQPYTAASAASAGGADIVVKGNRYTPTGGQWQFMKLGSSGSGRLSQVRWGRCIPQGELEVMVRMMLNGEETRSADSRCGPMKLKLKLKLGKVTGERSCVYDRSRMKTLVRGSVSQDRVLANETTYLVVSLPQPAGAPVRVPENDSVAKVYGERIGTCSAPEQRDDGRRSKP